MGVIIENRAVFMSLYITERQREREREAMHTSKLEQVGGRWGGGGGGGEGEGLQENRCIYINQPLSATATGLGGQR